MSEMMMKAAASMLGITPQQMKDAATRIQEGLDTAVKTVAAIDAKLDRVIAQNEIILQSMGASDNGQE